MENQSTYRIRTKLGETEPINIPVNLMQEYNSFEILSLKINTDDTYRSYTSTEGIVVGRVSTANNGLGIPNVRVSIFVPRGTYNQTDEEKAIYPFSSPTDLDGDRVRYNLLPTESDVDCYQVVGTFPSKRRILDNETICEVFEKFYKYTTVTNEAGDFMLTNIPTGKQRLHIDADLSDIGPFLSQKPYNMIENLGFDKNKFESTRQFKTSKDLDSLVQIISQDKTVYVYPYWGDITENSSEMMITRTDLSLNYEFKTQAIFMGCAITDKQSNSIRQNCTPTEKAGKMGEMVTGPGRIEMIRKTVDNKVEQYRIKGDALINENGVWCYAIPMNLDYVRTDEFGNIIPTDDPKKGVPTRARVRFRVTLNEMESDNDSHKRCSYLIPNNPKYNDEQFLKINSADYSFGSETWDESFVDLFWNKVYTVKNYVPRIQKTTRATNRKHTGIKMVNHFGDNNPFPYNNISIKLSFTYRLICVIVHIFINLITILNEIISILGALPCWLASLKLPIIGRPFKFALKIIPPCIELSSEFCDDGINKNATYPGCSGCVWNQKTMPECEEKQYDLSQNGEESAVCTRNEGELYNCVENQLAQENEATSFDFSNDWINGCLYMPLWYRKIKPKKSFFFGLFKRKAKDEWCAGEKNIEGRQLKLASFCAHPNTKVITDAKDYRGEKIEYNITQIKDNCNKNCHDVKKWVSMTNGVIMNRETMLGQTAWYYKSVEVTSTLGSSIASEYINYDGKAMVSKTLYATDIVLLGSLNDCDLNGIPKFFNYLRSSSYNMPTDVLFTDTEITYKFDEKNNLVDQESHKMSVASGCDWGNTNEYGYYDGGLFYSIGCASIEVDTVSCINLRRICELGIGLDEIKYVENIDVNNETGVGAATIKNENDELDYNNSDFYLRPDGFVSYDDIVDFDYRSMFATMNGNNLKTKINRTNGVKEYDFRYLYIDNFDGSLEQFMKDKQSRTPKANYRFNYNLEKTNKDYLLFRMSDRPYYYDGKSLVTTEQNTNEGPKQFALPKYQNSFYFYFGLKEGKTAIDLFNQQYNEPCATHLEEEENIPYETRPNGWCNVDSDKDESYKHQNYDGFLKINLENLPLPCTAILTSRSNSDVTYTIMTKLEDGEKINTNINHEKICFYGSDEWVIQEGEQKGELTDEGKKEFRDHEKYYFKYENPSYEDFPKEGVVNCEMLNNGEYNLFITDGEGNTHEYVITIKGEYLQFEDVEEKFKQPNNVLLKYYQKGDISQYDNVAKTPEETDGKEIKIEIPDDNELSAGVPYVTRNDMDMKYVEKENVIDGEYIRLNGTICIYNVIFNDEYVDDLLIEVEPYDKGKDENGKEYYIDEDFWETPSDEKTKYDTWYKKQMFNSHTDDKLNKGVTSIQKENDREYIEIDDNDNQYFHYGTTKLNNMEMRCYIIKCPKGDVNYRVRVTQLCYDEDKKQWYKTQNYIERKINVSQPTPYKLFINDADYDIIKDFKTGYTLMTDNNMQNPNGYTQPFTSWNFNDIQGWLELSNINENYNWDEDRVKYGSSNTTFGINPKTGEYELIEALRKKEENEPKEPQRYNYDNDTKYNEDYEKWLVEHEEWEYGPLNDDGNREDGYNEWDNENCGYVYLKEEAQILLNRIEFSNAVKSSFWIQCEDSEKTITYTVRTDDNPYDVWTIYNPEVVSQSNDDYNETESKAGDTNRINWKCIGESARYIDNIKVPTISAYSNGDFGIAEDNVRINMSNTHDGIRCFAQDNIAEKSKDTGSISIKPPYLVACVNSSGMTKPANLKKDEFFEEGQSKYGLKMYKFNDKYKVNDGQYEFFGFHLIDKIFAPDIVCWAYMTDIPYYLPWNSYDCTPDVNNKLGYTVKTEGILSGFIKNGMTNIKTKNEFITDFETRNIFDKEVEIKTYESDNEDSIPTRRCILYDKENGGGEILVYKNYRHTKEVKDDNQFRPVPNREGDLDFVDLNANCETTRTLFGSMKIVLKNTTLNQVLKKPTIFNHSSGEEGDKSLTLKVNCINSDTNRPITYYIFEASQAYQNSDKTNKKMYYPINGFDIHIDDNNNKTYTLECGCDETEENRIWDGSYNHCADLFNKNTLEKHFKDKYNKKDDLVWDEQVGVAGIDGMEPAGPAKSDVQWENQNGEVMFEESTGYGTTGIFTNLAHVPYFVIAVTENNCRAISPVYDFHIVYYVVGLTEVMGQKVLRTALVYVLKHENKCNVNYDGYDPLSTGPYCKTPRNYYLTQFDFTIDYTFADGTTLISSSGISYEKLDNKFVSKEEYEKAKEKDEVGVSYVEEKDGKYIVHSLTGGTLIEGDATLTEPSGNPISAGAYSYQIKNEDGTTYYQNITVDTNGNISYGSTSQKPSGTDLGEGTYYITTTNPITGEPVYVPFTYSNEISIELDYDPRIPYFMRYNDKPLTDKEYDSLEKLFKQGLDAVEKVGKYYVTDVVGLRHKCKLHKIIKSDDEWKEIIKPPKGDSNCVSNTYGH